MSGGHGHSHPHESKPQENAIHFGFTMFWSFSFLILFGFETFLVTLLAFLIWVAMGAAILGRWITPIPPSHMYQFSARFLGLSLVFFFISGLVFGFTYSPYSSSSRFQQRYVHLDFKGAPPTFQYLKEMIPRFKEWGATGLLIEWEDTFPWSGELSDLKSKKFSYSPDEVREIVRLAREKGLSVIPYIPAISHVQFLLRHPKFAYLREQPDNFQTIATCRDEAVDIFSEMIAQISLLHPRILEVHIGGNEAFGIGAGQCSSRSLKENLVLYVTKISRNLQDRGLQTLIWDDMLRTWDQEDLSLLPSTLSVAVWYYKGEMKQENVIYESLPKYNEVFPSIWAASAFKGAISEGTDFAFPSTYLKNSLLWLQLASTTDTNFRGIFLMGYSRFSSSSPLCEILPVGIPSLVLNLRVLEEGGFSSSLKKEALESIGLSNLPVSNSPSSVEEIAQIASAASQKGGSYQGAPAFKLMAELYLLKSQPGEDGLGHYVDMIKEEMRRELEGILPTPSIEEVLEKIDDYKRSK